MAFTARTSKPQPRRQTRESRQAHRRAAVIPRAQSEGNDSGYNVEAAELARKLGLPDPNKTGIFGFSPFAELFVGRTAMLCALTGFALGVGFELLTGVPTLQQIGIITPNPTLGKLLIVLPTGLSFIFLGRTLDRARKGEMSPIEMKGYSNFFGLYDEADTKKAPADNVLGTTPQSDIDDARSSMPADKVLGISGGDESEEKASQEQRAEEESEPESMKTSNGYYQVQQWEVDFAEDVERTNGRWAQLGFLTLITIEAFTGKGLVGQLITYGKLSGILGPESGL